MRSTVLAPLFLAFFAATAEAAYDANGVALGANEQAVIKQFPSAHCKALQWKSRAADRRCDDAKISFGGVEARVTFYLNKDAVEAFDVRFDVRDAERVAAFLKSRYGAPRAETRDKVQTRAGATRDVYKVRWEKDGETALLAALAEKRRASLLVWRGNFEDEIYRVQ